LNWINLDKASEVLE